MSSPGSPFSGRNIVKPVWPCGIVVTNSGVLKGVAEHAGGPEEVVDDEIDDVVDDDVDVTVEDVEEGPIGVVAGNESEVNGVGMGCEGSLAQFG